jgi:hypothetical protein
VRFAFAVERSVRVTAASIAGYRRARLHSLRSREPQHHCCIHGRLCRGGAHFQISQEDVYRARPVHYPPERYKAPQPVVNTIWDAADDGGRMTG